MEASASIARRRSSSAFFWSPLAPHVLAAPTSRALFPGVCLQPLLEPGAGAVALAFREVEGRQSRERLHEAGVQGKGLLERRARLRAFAPAHRQQAGLHVGGAHLRKRDLQLANHCRRAIEFAARQEAAGEDQPSLETVRLAPQHLVGHLRGRDQPVALQIDPGELYLRGRRARVQAQHLRVRLRGGVHVAARLVDGAVQVVGFRALRVHLHGLLSVRQGLVRLPLGEQKPSPDHAGLGVGRLLRDHLVYLSVRVGGLPVRVVQRRHPRPRERPGARRRAQLLEHREGVGVALDVDVVVRQGKLGGRSVTPARHLLEVGFGLRGAVGGDVEGGQGLVGRHIAGVERQRRLEGRLRLRHPAGRPEELRQRQLRQHRLGVRRDGLPERGLGFLVPSLGELEDAQVGLAVGCRIQRDGLLDHRDGPVDVGKPREGVGPEHEGFRVLGVNGQGLVRAGLRIFGPARHEQQRARLQLGVGVVRQQVGRAHVLGQRARPIPLLQIKLAELEAGGHERRVLLSGVAVLQDGGVNVAFREVGVAAIEVALGAPRVPRGHPHRHHGSTDDDRNPASGCHRESALQREG